MVGAPVREISREDLAALPIYRHEGEVLLVATPAELERAMADLRHETVAGFDTETRPAFRAGESYPPSLVQIASARAVYVFQLKRMDFAPALREVFSSAAIVKAGVSVRDDLIGLKKLFEYRERSVLDLGRVAKRQGFRQTGVRNLAAMLLGKRIPKGQKTSNWAAQRLSASQINYAATDAWVCRELYLHFRNLGWLEGTHVPYETLEDPDSPERGDAPPPGRRASRQ